MILKIFSPKTSAKKLAVLTQNKAKLCKILIITLIFEKHANFFAENCQKSEKIVIITSTPGSPVSEVMRCHCAKPSHRASFVNFCSKILPASPVLYGMVKSGRYWRQKNYLYIPYDM
jgi:hypothetical protein